MSFHAKARRINTQHHQQALSSIAMRHQQRHASAACTHGHDIRLQGMYEASFTPEVAGLYGINAVVHGAPIRGCPLRVKVLADETLAKNCRCFGGGMAHAVAGEPTSFTIQAVDGRGVARKSGGDVFDISITGPEDDAPHATIRDNAEGTYVVTWAGKYSGLYSIRVALDGQSVGGTPFNCNVLPTAIASARCDVQVRYSFFIPSAPPRFCLHVGQAGRSLASSWRLREAA